jgi:two-component system, chemotaxis family, CheB/CheR fusion protein
MTSFDCHQLRLVIADDNADAALALTMLLDRLGFDVVATYFDGESALAGISAQQPDVAILDIALPDIDGYEVARRVRNSLDVPPFLIAVTGLSDTCDRVDASEAGFVAHFVKPLETNKLRELLLSFLDNRLGESDSGGG